MKNEKQSAVLIIGEMISSGDNKESTQQRMIPYDLAPLGKLIEFGGIDHLINSLRSLHTDIVEASLASLENGGKGIFEDAPDLVNNLFVIRELANVFDEIKMGAYQMKDYPVENIQNGKNNLN